MLSGGTGHLGTWAGVCQRITNSAELLPPTPAGQWQVRPMTRCDRSSDGSHVSLKMDCCFSGNPYEDGNDAHLAFMLDFCFILVVFITVYSEYLCSGSALQTAAPCVETWRRSSPSSRDYVWLWRTVPSKKTLLLKQSHWPQCTCPVLLFRHSVPHLLHCTHTVIHIELQEVSFPCCSYLPNPSICLDLCRVSESQQRVAGCYLNLMGQIKTLYQAYCSSHPSAVCILTDHRWAAACKTAMD